MCEGPILGYVMCRYLRHLAQKKAEGDLQRVMREFAKTAKLYSQKIAASIKLQVDDLHKT